MREVTLPGGNTTGAVLIDGVVHKRASPWTATVHAVLRHLEVAGFDGAPRALGFDEQGREMLTYLPGETIGNRDPWPAWASADAMLAQVGRWLRRVHDLTADFPPPADENWFIGGSMRPGLIVGHQDAAPYNAVVDGDRLIGFCDWDIAGPSSPEWDLAFSALSWVPLASARDGLPERSRRLHLLLDAYGYDGDRRAFGAVVPQRARRQAEVIRRMADAGDAASIALLPIAEMLERSATEVQALPDDFWTRTDIYEQYEQDADQYLAAHGLRVAADMLPAVRDILVRETRNEADTYAGRGTVPGNTDLMRICAAQLWHAGAVEDALLVHRARRTSMDATGAVDAYLMLGAGVSRTKNFLAALGTDEAREILDDIAWLGESYDAERCAADLDDWYGTR